MFPDIFKIKHNMLNKYSLEKANTGHIDRYNFVYKSKHFSPLVKE